MTNQEVRIQYIRPGKGVTDFVEDLITENEHSIKTFKTFPDDIVESLTQALRKNGFIAQDQITTCITKIYFFDEYFDLLLFQDEQGEILGYYSDIGTPLIEIEHGYQMTDAYLK